MEDSSKILQHVSKTLLHIQDSSHQARFHKLSTVGLPIILIQVLFRRFMFDKESVDLAFLDMFNLKISSNVPVANFIHSCLPLFHDKCK